MNGWRAGRANGQSLDARTLAWGYICGRCRAEGGQSDRLGPGRRRSGQWLQQAIDEDRARAHPKVMFPRWSCGIFAVAAVDPDSERASTDRRLQLNLIKRKSKGTKVQSSKHPATQSLALGTTYATQLSPSRVLLI